MERVLREIPDIGHTTLKRNNGKSRECNAWPKELEKKETTAGKEVGKHIKITTKKIGKGKQAPKAHVRPWESGFRRQPEAASCFSRPPGSFRRSQLARRCFFDGFVLSAGLEIKNQAKGWLCSSREKGALDGDVRQGLGESVREPKDKQVETEKTFKATYRRRRRQRLMLFCMFFGEERR